MKRKLFKRMMAMTVIATMLFSSMVVNAEDSDDGVTQAGDTIDGTGELEDYVNKDVFKITLPTVSDVDFTIDPQGLLSIASKDTHTLGEGAVYFTNAPTTQDGATTYSNTSDAIKVVNKSSYDVDVTATVTVTLPEGVVMVDDIADLEDATVPSLYLGLIKDDGSVDGEGQSTATTTALKAGANDEAKIQVARVPEAVLDTEANDGSYSTEGYTIKATAGENGEYTYSYGLTDDFDAETDAKSAIFKLTGACDKATADWTAVKSQEVTASVVWACEKHVDAPESAAPSIATTSYDLATGTAVEIAYDLGTGAGAATDVASVTYVNPVSGSSATLVKGTDYTVAEGKITLLAARVDKILTQINNASADSTTLNVTFDDAVPTSVTITLAK